jgi:septum formation topological specificity factor MinE
MTTYEQLKELLEAFAVEDEKFNNGKSSASTNARKRLQDIIVLAKSRRNEITAEKNARKEPKVAE